MGKYDDRSYVVGKGKPPHEHRWKKGQSGNARRAKPKPPANEMLPEKLRRIGQKKVSVNVDGKAVSMTLAEALLQSAYIGSIGGSQALKLRAIALFESLGVFAVPPENRASHDEKRRKFIEKLAEEARREHGG